MAPFLTAPMICLTVVLSIHPAKVREFQLAMGENAAHARREPGCRRFEIHQVLEREAEFVLWEVYDDLAALEAHYKTPHFARWKQVADSLVLRKDAWRCQPLSLA